MEMQPFQHTHLHDFPHNHFSGVDPHVQAAIDDAGFLKHTVFGQDGHPLAFIFFKESAPKVFGAFFLVSSKFKARDCVELRDFVQLLITQQNAKEVWTASRQDPRLARWHEFLGMRREGTIQIEDETYDVWRM